MATGARTTRTTRAFLRARGAHVRGRPRKTRVKRRPSINGIPECLSPADLPRNPKRTPIPDEHRRGSRVYLRKALRYRESRARNSLRPTRDTRGSTHGKEREGESVIFITHFGSPLSSAIAIKYNERQTYNYNRETNVEKKTYNYLMINKHFKKHKVN